jgi:hypothetical protein
MTRFDGGNWGKTMRLNTVDHRSTQSDQRKSQDENTQHGLMTPARRAALDALERQLHEFLKAIPR